MTKTIPGIHHVTAIASDPQRNLDFYTQVLGLRLVKLTVNFDDPGTYHFYFGDAAGHPGSILTFFPWPGARQGRRGNGQAAALAFAIPQSATSYWQDRLRRFDVRTGATSRFNEEVIDFADPDGLRLELVSDTGQDDFAPWADAPVPPEQAIRGLHSVTLWEEDPERTAGLLTGTMGFRLLGSSGNRSRYAAAGESAARWVDVVSQPGGPVQQMGAGVVHHVAWRTPDDAGQQAWRAELAELGYHVTPIIDRQYFRSIYYREPGGVLFEIATDAPGFAIDEPFDGLGTGLKLPPQYEPARADIEAALPALRREPSRVDRR